MIDCELEPRDDRRSSSCRFEGTEDVIGFELSAGSGVASPSCVDRSSARSDCTLSLLRSFLVVSAMSRVQRERKARLEGHPPTTLHAMGSEKT